MYTHIEDTIYDLFTTIEVRTPKDLNMYTIAKKLGVEIIYRNKAFRLNNEIIIKKGTSESEWQCFGHEVGHNLRHVGNQFKMPKLFKDLQEYQANHFAYHFCVPTFMLDEIKDVTVDVIMMNFNVDFEFALRRLEMYQNKLYVRFLYAMA